MYLVGDRPSSWMSWSDDHDHKKGEGGAGGAGIYPEELLDKLVVGSYSSGVRIHWDGE
jgi:hypothetical protein